MGYGKISPLTVNGIIQPYSNQTWAISPPPSSNSLLILSISNLSMNVDICKQSLGHFAIYDKLAINPNRPIYDFCLHKPYSWIFSTTGNAFVAISTGKTSIMMNFIVTYYIDTNLYKCGSLLQPAVLLDNSMIITDGTQSTNLMARSVQCAWLITPQNHGTVTLILRWVSIKYGGSIIVYDGSSSSGTILWNCVGASLTVPPIITSSSNALFISYTSDSTSPIQYYGFLGEYYSNFIGSRGSGRGNTLLAMSSALNIHPPGNIQSILTRPLNYTWYVNPTSIQGQIYFSFSRMNLNPTLDKLIIYDGMHTTNNSKILGIFSGSSLPPKWIITSGTTATIVFTSRANPLTSDLTATPADFELSYFADGPNYHCGFTTNPAPLRSPSFTFTDGSSSTETIYANQYCAWSLQPFNSTGIFIFFNRFSVVGGSVNIYINSISSANLFTSISNTNAVPAPILIRNPNVFVTYQTSSSPAGYGFSITYYGIQNPESTKLQSFTGDSVVRLVCSSLVTLTLYSNQNLLKQNNAIQNEVNPKTKTLQDFNDVTMEGNTAIDFNGIEDKLNHQPNHSSYIEPSARLLTAVSIPPQTNLTWYITPTNANGPICFAISFINFTSGDCSSVFVRISNSINPNAATLATLCGTDYSTIGTPLTPENANGSFNRNPVKTAYNWIQTSSTAARIDFVSKLSHDVTGNFAFSYYSDGSNQHCGFAINPAIYTAPSFIFTDGSTSTQSMFVGDYCEWIINPKDSNLYLKDSDQLTIVLEFLQLDLRGGASIAIFDGSNSSAPQLFGCYGCSVIPRPIVATSTSVFVQFNSATTTSSLTGSGFKLLYWTLLTSSIVDEGSESSLMLEIPSGMSVTNDIVNNETVAFYLQSNNQLTSLSYYPYYTAVLSPELTPEALNQASYDGRSAQFQTSFQSLNDLAQICGFVTSKNTMNPSAQFNSQQISYSSTQKLNSFIQSRAEYKLMWSLSGAVVAPTNSSPLPSFLSNSNSIETSSSFPSYSETYDGPISSANVCKYVIESGSQNAITIHLNNLHFPSRTTGRLQILGGIHGYYSNPHNSIYNVYESPAKVLLFDSHDPMLMKLYSEDISFVAPCGRATLLLAINESANNSVLVDYAVQLSYSNVASDSDGEICKSYVNSLRPPIARGDPLLNLYISVSAMGMFVFLASIAYYLHRYKQKNGYIFCLTYPRFFKKSYKVITPLHPAYHPRWDHFRNKYFLPFGQCVICKNEAPLIVIEIAKCKHTVCLEDLTAYLSSALGDISMFPVKCPMHHEGCTEVIISHTAKRVLTESQYSRFIEFSDRILYGDGMRCIFCNNYVIYPESLFVNNASSFSRVECPYCDQKFCVRCKKPWHYQGRCPIDIFDEGIDVWRAKSGAMKCPGCQKLIEKDDPDTCNHMVHKSTDSIPCIVERTDFCYLCGEAVSEDYPHVELINPSVNHFPDGVFQKCHTVKQRERLAELEKIKKQKRNQSKLKRNGPRQSEFVIPEESEGDEGLETIVGGGSNGDALVIITEFGTTSTEDENQRNINGIQPGSAGHRVTTASNGSNSSRSGDQILTPSRIQLISSTGSISRESRGNDYDLISCEEGLTDLIGEEDQIMQVNRRRRSGKVPSPQHETARKGLRIVPLIDHGVSIGSDSLLDATLNPSANASPMMRRNTSLDNASSKSAPTMVSSKGIHLGISSSSSDKLPGINSIDSSYQNASSSSIQYSRSHANSPVVSNHKRDYYPSYASPTQFRHRPHHRIGDVGHPSSSTAAVGTTGSLVNSEYRKAVSRRSSSIALHETRFVPMTDSSLISSNPPKPTI